MAGWAPWRVPRQDLLPGAGAGWAGLGAVLASAVLSRAELVGPQEGAQILELKAKRPPDWSVWAAHT